MSETLDLRVADKKSQRWKPMTGQIRMWCKVIEKQGKEEGERGKERSHDFQASVY